MKAKKYIETVKRINNKKDLERLLSYIENDTEISARKYESIRTCILKKIYEQAGTSGPLMQPQPVRSPERCRREETNTRGGNKDGNIYYLHIGNVRRLCNQNSTGDRKEIKP